MRPCTTPAVLHLMGVVCLSFCNAVCCSVIVHSERVTPDDSCAVVESSVMCSVMTFVSHKIGYISLSNHTDI